jgi:hypothetical protein
MLMRIFRRSPLSPANVIALRFTAASEDGFDPGISGSKATIIVKEA